LAKKISLRANWTSLIRRRLSIQIATCRVGLRSNRSPEEYKAIVDKAYQDLVTAISDLDDEVGMAFLEEKPITPQLLKAGIAARLSQTSSFRLSVDPPLKIRGAVLGRRCRRLSSEPSGYSGCDGCSPIRMRRLKLLQTITVTFALSHSTVE
jgi:hypothetical protein